MKALNYTNLDGFLYQTIDKIRANRDEILTKIGQERQKTKGTWDACARRIFYRYLMNEFCKYFKLDHICARRYVFCEGVNPIPKSKRETFFNSGVYP